MEINYTDTMTGEEYTTGVSGDGHRYGDCNPTEG